MDEPRNLVVRLSPDVSDIVRGRLSEAPGKTPDDVVNDVIRAQDREAALAAVLRKIEEAENDPRPRLSAAEFSSRLDAMIASKRDRV